MEYFVPKHVTGKAPNGVPFRFFPGIHHIPDALANSHQANDLGIVTVEEMSDDDWRSLGLSRDAWMAANRPKPEPVDAKPDSIPDPAPETAPKATGDSTAVADSLVKPQGAAVAPIPRPAPLVVAAGVSKAP